MHSTNFQGGIEETKDEVTEENQEARDSEGGDEVWAKEGWPLSHAGGDVEEGTVKGTVKEAAAHAAEER